MEWCLDCHRNPAKNLRPTSQIYNMAWERPAESRPVWCSVSDEKSGLPTAQSVNCVTKDPTAAGPQIAALELPKTGAHGEVADGQISRIPTAVHYQKFTSQDELGHFLLQRYKIRTPRELSSCEVCHR
jgi:hypothetical protein